MKDSTVFDWGQTPNLAPSIKRASPLSWVAASTFFGVVASLVAMALVWRPLPWLPGPPGSLPDHLAMVGKFIVHAVFGAFYAPDVRFYSGWLSQLDSSERLALVWRGGLALWCFLMPWVLLAGSYLQGRDGLIHLRGSTRKSGLDAVREINRKLAARVKRRPDHEIAPGIPYPADLWTRHVLVVGGVGSGKSTAIKPLIDKVVASGEQMLLFDPKSEFTMGFAAPEIIAPWDARSLSWDIARDMRNLLDMRRFAATMIKESQDPMWSNASRQLLVGLMIYLKGTRGVDWGWLELKDLIALPQAKLLEIMKRWHPEAERAVEKASVTTAGILINLASFCSSIFDLAEAWGEVPSSRRISFVDWIQGRSGFKQIILQGHGAYAELTKSYVEGIVGVVSAMVNSVEMTDDPGRKIWFIADEFAQMGKMPVRPLFEVGRSRGVRCVVACQDLVQLEEIHGAQMVKALVGMCGTLLVGQVMQGETAEQLCKAFGAREVERANTSSSTASGGAGGSGSTTLSFNRDEVPLYKPSELTSRLGLTEDGTGVVLLLFTGGHAYELRWPLYDIRKERAPHVPAPWTLGAGFDWTVPLAAAGPVSAVPAMPAPANDKQEESEQANLGADQAERLAIESSEGDQRAGASPAGQTELILRELDAMEEASRDDGVMSHAKEGVGAVPATGSEAERDLLNSPSGAAAQNGPGALSMAGGDAARFREARRSAQRAHEGSAVGVEHSPKEAIVVQVLGEPMNANGLVSEVEPMFDAAAELAAMRFGLGPVGMAVEVVAAIDAAQAPVNAPKQRVHMGQAQRSS